MHKMYKKRFIRQLASWCLVAVLLAAPLSGTAFAGYHMAVGDNANDDPGGTSIRIGANLNTGDNPEVGGSNSIAIGVQTKAMQDSATAVGYMAQALGNFSTAVGSSAKASGLRSSAYGDGAVAAGSTNSAYGSYSEALEESSSAFGYKATAAKNKGSAFGDDAKAAGEKASAFGSGSRAQESLSSACGHKAYALGEESSAFGAYAETKGKHTSALGFAAKAQEQGSSSFGAFARAMKEGSSASGYQAMAEQEDSSAYGASAQATAYGSMALGARSVADKLTTQAGIYLPSGVTAADKAAVEATVKGTRNGGTKMFGVVSIGDTTNAFPAMRFTRQLAGVAAGIADTDAVNVAQLKALEGVVSRTASMDIGLAIKYDSAAKDLVALNKGGAAVTLSNVKDADLSANSTEAVTGKQLRTFGTSVAQHMGQSFTFLNPTSGVISGDFTVNGKTFSNVQDALTEAASSGGGGGTGSWTLSVNGTQTAIGSGDRFAIAEGDNLTINKDGSSGVYSFNVSKTPEFDSVKVGAIDINKSGINMGGNKITGLANGGVYEGSSDAVTGDQLWNAYRRIDTIDSRVQIVGAHAAALSAMHPVAYNPYEPTTISAGAGFYRNEQSLAVGMFHYVRENLLINAGLAFNSDGDTMGRAGISFALGKGGRKQPSMVKDMGAVQQQMAAMQEMLLALKEKDEQKEATIKELQKRDEEKEATINELQKRDYEKEMTINKLKEALEEKK